MSEIILWLVLMPLHFLTVVFIPVWWWDLALWAMVYVLGRSSLAKPDFLNKESTGPWCRNCGYSLHGREAASECPECGNDLTKSGIRTIREAQDRYLFGQRTNWTWCILLLTLAMWRMLPITSGITSSTITSSVRAWLSSPTPMDQIHALIFTGHVTWNWPWAFNRNEHIIYTYNVDTTIFIGRNQTRSDVIILKVNPVTMQYMVSIDNDVVDNVTLTGFLSPYRWDRKHKVTFSPENIKSLIQTRWPGWSGHDLDWTLLEIDECVRIRAGLLSANQAITRNPSNRNPPSSHTSVGQGGLRRSLIGLVVISALNLVLYRTGRKHISRQWQLHQGDLSS